jgi:plastocyanin
MTISLRGRMLALTFLVALVAAACGGNGNDAGGAGDATTTGASASSGSTGSDGAGRYGGYGNGDDTGATGETSDDHGMGSDEGEAEDGPTVQANNFAFDPTEPSVESGEDLYLRNGNANTPHTFTVEGTDIDVELAPLASDEIKVDLDPGTYEFHCRFHAQMTGTLTVT